MGLNSDKRAESRLEDFKYPNQFPNWVSNYKVQFLSVSDAGHLPYLEKPAIVNKEVFQYLHQ